MTPDFISVSSPNELFRSGKYSEAKRIYRQMVEANHPLKGLLDKNIRVCERLEKLNEKIDLSVNQQVKPTIVITMTTISSRLEKIELVIKSLHKQNLQPIEIHLYVSEEPYLLDEGISKDNSIIRKISEYPLIKIYFVKNTGPYRKIMPFLENHFSAGWTNDRLFVTVDDDTIYPEDFLSTLYDNYLKFNCVIAYRGRNIELNGRLISEYSKWTNGRTEVLYSGLPTGKDGVLYSTTFFEKTFLDFDLAKDLAPTADDLWIKWHCGLNGVAAMILNPLACTSDYKSFPVVDYSKEYRGKSLFSIYNSSSSHGKNDTSVKRLEKYFTEKYDVCLGDFLYSYTT